MAKRIEFAEQGIKLYEQKIKFISLWLRTTTQILTQTSRKLLGLVLPFLLSYKCEPARPLAGSLTGTGYMRFLNISSYFRS